MNTQAHARGVGAGNAFRNLKRGLKALDQRFVSKAKAHKMPGWVGHAPLALSLVVIATTLIFGSLIVSGLILSVWALMLFSSVMGQTNLKEQNKASYERFSWEQDWDKDFYNRYDWENDK